MLSSAKRGQTATGVSLTQLRRCQDYRLDILSDNTALLNQNLTALPGDFIIDHCEDQSLAGQTYLLRVGLLNLKPGCPDFAGETYRVEVDGETVAHLSARSFGQGINGYFRLDIDPAYPLSENASILRITRLNSESGAGESRRLTLPCDSRVASSGCSHTVYTLTSRLALVLFSFGLALSL